MESVNLADPALAVAVTPTVHPPALWADQEALHPRDPRKVRVRRAHRAAAVEAELQVAQRDPASPQERALNRSAVRQAVQPVKAAGPAAARWRAAAAGSRAVNLRAN